MLGGGSPRRHAIHKVVEVVVAAKGAYVAVGERRANPCSSGTACTAMVRLSALALVLAPAVALNPSVNVVVSPGIKIAPPAPQKRGPAVPSSAPLLTRTEQLRLARDGEVQRKDRRGRGGQCVHVVETNEPLDKVWKQLRNVDGWADLMRGIKTSKTREWLDETTRTCHFSVTKFRLPCDLVLAEETDSRGAQVLRFDLDRASPAVKRCSGAWVVERVGEKTRVSLAASIEATRVVPGMIVDMVATKALGRATAWLKE